MASFATSYIPTGASQTTRAADVATIQGSNFYSFYNQNEGSIVTNAIKPFDSIVSRVVNINTSNINYLNIGILNTVSSSGIVLYDGSSQAIFGSANTAAGNYKQALGYKINDVNYAQNNVLFTNDTSALIPLADKMQIGAITTNYGTTYIKQISYYPQRLSDSVLKGLTA